MPITLSLGAFVWTDGREERKHRAAIPGTTRQRFSSIFSMSCTYKAIWIQNGSTYVMGSDHQFMFLFNISNHCNRPCPVLQTTEIFRGFPHYGWSSRKRDKRWRNHVIFHDRVSNVRQPAFGSLLTARLQGLPKSQRLASFPRADDSNSRGTVDQKKEVIERSSVTWTGNSSVAYREHCRRGWTTSGSLSAWPAEAWRDAVIIAEEDSSEPTWSRLLFSRNSRRTVLRSSGSTKPST